MKNFALVHSDSVFESLETGYLEKCAINLKAPMAGTDCPTQVWAIFLLLILHSMTFW